MRRCERRGLNGAACWEEQQEGQGSWVRRPFLCHHSQVICHSALILPPVKWARWT